MRLRKQHLRHKPRKPNRPANELQPTGDCRDCPLRPTCTEACDLLQQQLPAPASGREPDGLDPQRAEEIAHLSDCRRTQPPRTAAICALYYQCGWSQAEIATALNISQARISQIVGRARDALSDDTPLFN